MLVGLGKGIGKSVTFGLRIGGAFCCLEALEKVAMGKNRIEMRRQAEAAEAAEKEAAATTKPARASRAKSSAAKAEKEASGEKTKKKAVRKTREKARERRRAIWVIYSGTMREEGRYPYWEKAAAEERLEMLRARGKRLYFMQMVKELIVGDGQVQTIVPQLEEEEGLDVQAPAAAAEEGEEGLAIEIDEGDFAASEEEEEEEEEAEEADEE